MPVPVVVILSSAKNLALAEIASARSYYVRLDSTQKGPAHHEEPS